MKKYLIGVCVLGAITGQAQAEGNVTIYGRLDASVQHIAKTASQTLINEGVGGTSNIGFRGSEDLGGGVTVLFDLETKVVLDTGVGGASALSGAASTGPSSIFSRNAYVAVKGRMGQLTLGRNYTSAVRALYNMNVIPAGINTGLAGNAAAQGIGNDFWNNNQIAYYSPDMNGFSFEANYAPGEFAGHATQGTDWGAAIIYRKAGLVLNAGYQKDQDIAATGKSLNWHMASAAYVFNDWKVVVAFDRVNNPGLIAGWFDSKLLTAGVAYTLTPSITVGAQYFTNHETVKDTTSKQLVLNARYALSKRSFLYTTATRTKSGTLGIMPMYGTPGIANSNANGVAVGMQHFF